MSNYPKFMLVMFIIAGLLAVVFAPFGAPLADVAAQGDGLSEEESALLDQVFAGLAAAAQADGYLMSGTRTNFDRVLINLPAAPAAREQVGTAVVEGQTRTVVVEGQRNVQSERSLTYSRASFVDGSPVAGGSLAYAINTELRLVDGEMYLLATYPDDPGDAPPLPAGWQVVTPEFVASFPVFSPLGLQNELEHRDAPFSLVTPEVVDLMRSAAVAVTRETYTLSDGRGVTLITVEIDPRAALLNLRADGPDDPETLLFVEAFERGRAAFQFGLDAGGNVVYITSVLEVVVTGIDYLAMVSGEGIPPGTTLDFESRQTISLEGVLLDAPQEPVSAPQQG